MFIIRLHFQNIIFSKKISANFSWFWQILADFDRFWQNLADFGRFWLFSAYFGIFWLFSEDFGRFWLISANFFRFWLFSADFVWFWQIRWLERLLSGFNSTEFWQDVRDYIETWWTWLQCYIFRNWQILADLVSIQKILADFGYFRQI